jgi:hypothetical protein
MSVAEMSRRAVARRTAVLRTTRSGSVAEDARQSPPKVPPEPSRPQEPPPNAVSEAVRTVAAYVPTEIVTLYVAAGAAIDVSNSPPAGGQWLLFWVTLLMTPALVWTGFALASKNAGRALPVKPQKWPVPEMIIAVVAFVLWAFTLPKSPFSQFSWFRPAMGTAALLIGTTVIGVVAALIRRT